MKHSLQITLMGAMAVVVSSCGQFGSLNNKNFDPSTNPLDSPGSQRRLQADTQRFTPGTWVNVIDANAGLFERVPDGDDQPTEQLPLGSTVKVVGNSGSYVKVETEEGDIGYVPAIMVAKPGIEGDPTMPFPHDPLQPEPLIDPIDPTLPGDLAPEPNVEPLEVEENVLPPTIDPEPETPETPEISPGPALTPEIEEEVIPEVEEEAPTPGPSPIPE